MSAGAPIEIERVEIDSEAELWKWLDQNHAQPDSVLLVTWKASRRDRYVSREQVLDALIAYGWIDGRRYKLDDERTMQLISPRRQQVWAKTYRDRAARLIADERMRPPGQAAIDKAKASGRWDSLQSVDDLVEPGALVSALEAGGGAGWWSGAAPSYRRNVLRWIAAAKREETATKRINIIADHAAEGRKVPNY